MAPRTEYTSRTQRTERDNHGFTLLEMMLVIVLIGITSTLVIPRLSSDRDPFIRSGSMLMITLGNALEQATLRERLYGLAVAKNGWQLMVYSSEHAGKRLSSGQQTWQQARISPFNLPEDMHISLQVEQQEISLPERLTPETEPQLWIYSGGETSVFNLRLSQGNCVQHVSASGFMSFQRAEVRCDDE